MLISRYYNIVIKNYKNYLYSNVIAISGYPVLWCIYWFIFCIMNPVGGGDIIGFILIPFSTIYCLVVLAITLCVFIVELILKKSNRQIKLLHCFDFNFPKLNIPNTKIIPRLFG